MGRHFHCIYLLKEIDVETVAVHHLSSTANAYYEEEAEGEEEEAEEEVEEDEIDL